jgi:peptide deformylase
MGRPGGSTLTTGQRHGAGRGAADDPTSSVYFAPMSVRPIVMLGDPRLRLKGKPVDSFGKYLHELLDDLAHTMRDAPGVGLAAPQLGEAMQACVIEVESQLYELVNPRIVRSAGDDRDLEGCLSIPGYVAYVTRREKVWVVAQDRHGKKIKVAGSGLLGRALQHELDHLDGKLYIDYLDSMDELMPVGQGDDDAEVREATSALA